MAIGEQPFAEVRAKETGTAGDQNAFRGVEQRRVSQISARGRCNAISCGA
jgi:hypothetical protein